MISASQVALFAEFDEQEEDLSTSFFEFARVSREQEGLLSTAQAAIILGITSTCVGEYGRRGTLTRWEFWGKSYYSLREVGDRRFADRSKGGRPKRTLGQALKVGGKVMMGMDLPQCGAIAID
jgi:hypothetical protein